MTESPFFRHVRRAPTGPIADVARESWLVEAERCRMAVEAALPDASVELYFNLGAAGRHVSGTTAARALAPRAAWVVGPRDHPLYVEKETRDCDIVAIRLHPWMAERVLGVPAIELRESLIDLELFWGSAVDAVRNRLHRTGDPVQRLAIVETAVASHVRHDPVCDTQAARSLCHAAERDVHATIGQLAARHGLTHRRVIEL